MTKNSPSAKELWTAAAQTTVLLPSGFRVRGILPSPTELIRKRIMPYQLRQAITSMAGRKMSDLTETQMAQLVEGRRYQAVAFIREVASPGAGFEPVELTVEELGRMPPADVEALDDIIMGLATPEMVTMRSEVALGMRDAESVERAEAEEEGNTEAGWTDFRELGGGADAGSPSGDVAPASSESAAEPVAATARVRTQRRTRGAADVVAQQELVEEG